MTIWFIAYFNKFILWYNLEVAEKAPKRISGKERFFRDDFAGKTLDETAELLGLAKKTLLTYMEETAHAIYLRDGKIAYSRFRAETLFPGTPKKPEGII